MRASVAGAEGRTRTALGGVLWILTPVFFAGQAFAQAGWSGTPYSLFHDTISDLGTTVCQRAVRDGHAVKLCSPWHAAMNVAFVLTGLLILVGLLLLGQRWPATRLARLGLVCLALAGAGKVVVGLVPWNVDYTLHTLGGLGFLVGDLGLICLGLALRSQRRWAALAIVLGAIGLLGLLTAPAGSGIAERLADYPMFVWFVLVGIAALRDARLVDAAAPVPEGPTP
jgi:hypothetical membrane protein